jgi:hypothetical protein
MARQAAIRLSTTIAIRWSTRGQQFIVGTREPVNFTTERKTAEVRNSSIFCTVQLFLEEASDIFAYSTSVDFRHLQCIPSKRLID